MKIRFVPNIQFTRLIKIGGLQKEFNFRKLRGANEGIFTVDTVDERGNRIMFRMQKEDEEWKLISHQLPAWIVEKEHIFHELIEEETA